MIKIITYSEQYKADFIRLNTEWIETCFRLEESDLKTFSHIDSFIIGNGGQIFLTIDDNSGEVVGCCALINHPDKDSYELVKMAVSLQGLPGRIQNATARGKHVDCVSRSFCPKLSIPEDPVCGSAHCQIAPYWASVLGRNTIEAYQASHRGGSLHCEILNGRRIKISGEAVLVAISEIVAMA